MADEQQNFEQQEQPAPPVAPAEQTAPVNEPQAKQEAQDSPNLVTGGEGQHDSPEPADVQAEKPAASDGAANEGLGSGFEVNTENPDHEPTTTYHAVNQQTANPGMTIETTDHPHVADAREDRVKHHDEDGVVIPGHEMDSEVGRALAIQDARARAVAAPPMLGDSQPGMQTVQVKTVAPVQVDGRNRRSDEDALVGHFVDVVDGDHAGRRGAFERVLKYGEDGWPTQALVRSRDEFNELLTVAYKHLRPAHPYSGGR